MISTLLPNLSPLELIRDRIHRIPKPQNLADSLPRDVLMHIHFYSVKEQLLTKARALNTLPQPYASVQLFADLLKFTLQMRRQLNAITKVLTNHQINYRWCYPTT